MALLIAGFPTLLDVVNKQDPNGMTAKVIELQSKVNPILDDIAWRQGNLDTGHRFTARLALPGLTWRKFNQGIASTKTTNEQFVETCGMLEGISKVDDELATASGDPSGFRADEDMAFIQAMNIEMVNALFYYSVATTPERLQGLTPRLNTISGNTQASVKQIIVGDASASGANQTSIWLIGWSDHSVYGIFPKNSIGGIARKDLGLQMALDGSSNQYPAWMTRWTWQAGLVVADYRYVVRICNIDTQRWTPDYSVGADLSNLMIQARALLWEENTVQARYYMCRQAYSYLNQQLMKKGTVNFLEYVALGSARIPFFLGIPIRITDGITMTESVVV